MSVMLEAEGYATGQVHTSQKEVPAFGEMRLPGKIFPLPSVNPLRQQAGVTLF